MFNDAGDQMYLQTWPAQGIVLHRRGLTTDERLCIATTVAAQSADLGCLETLIGLAQTNGVPRSKFEEVLLQGILFYGFPRSVTAFECLHRCWPSPPPRRGGAPVDEWADAGRALFDAIYADNSETVRNMLRSYHGELHDFVLECAYGRILSRPELDVKTRELCAVGVLAAMGQTPQLIGHARGAMHLGAQRIEVKEALITALGDIPDVARHMRRITAR